jgi:hypothetical protein
MRLSAAILSLCFSVSLVSADEPPVEPEPAGEPQHLTDLRTWRESGLPVLSLWNVGGHSLAYKVGLVERGHRVIPTVSLPVRVRMDFRSPDGVLKQHERLVAEAASLARISDWRIPLGLRNAAQVSEELGLIRGTAENWRTEGAVDWRMKPDGTLDSTPRLDPWAPSLVFAMEGRRAGGSGWFSVLQTLAPNVSHLEYFDNDENGDGPKNYLKFTPADPTKEPPRPESWAWRDEATLLATSLRALDVARGLNFLDASKTAQIDIPRRRAAQYGAYFDSLSGAWSGAWQGKKLLRTNAYSADWDYTAYHTTGATCYPKVPVNLADPGYVGMIREWEPAWNWQRANLDPTPPASEREENPADPLEPVAAPRNPFARAVFVTISGKQALSPLLDGTHRAIDPPLYRDWATLLLWAAHDGHVTTAQPGVFAGSPCGVHLIEWQGHAETPDAPMFSDIQQAQLAGLGRADMAALTLADYTEALASGVDRILDIGLLREFWTTGVRAEITVTSPAGTQATALRHGGSYLVYLFDPRPPTGERVEVVLGGVPRSLAPLTKAGEYSLLAPPEEVDLVETRLP